MTRLIAAATFSQCAHGRPRSWRLAEAASPWSGATRCSMTTCSHWPASNVPRSVSYRPPAAMLTTTWCGSTAPSRHPAASLPTSPCSGVRPASGIPVATCSTRTSSMSAVAAWSRCWAPGGRTRSNWGCTGDGAGGAVLCGGSAGSLCWFSHAVSSFHEGAPRRMEGLGFLPWSNAVHYADEPGRRSAFIDAVADGMPAGFGVGDGAALHFVGTDLAEVVSSKPCARAMYVCADGDGGAVERELPVRFLGEAAAEDAERLNPALVSGGALAAGGRRGAGARARRARVRHPGKLCQISRATAVASWPWVAAGSRCRSALRRLTVSC